MLIRPLNQSDWQQLKNIRLKCLKEAAFAFGSQYGIEIVFSDKQWQGFLAAESRRYFGIINEVNELIGLAGIKLQQSNQWYIFGVYVMPEYRGQNLMTDLLSYLIIDTSELVSKNGLSLALIVATGNMPALKIYQQLGFKIVEELEPRQMGDGSSSSEYLMELVKL